MSVWKYEHFLLSLFFWQQGVLVAGRHSRERNVLFIPWSVKPGHHIRAQLNHPSSDNSCLSHLLSVCDTERDFAFFFTF